MSPLFPMIIGIAAFGLFSVTSTHAFGYALLALSAGLLASHWSTWRNAEANRGPFEAAQLNRRSQASALIGVVGLAIALFEEIPRRPMPIAIYLACLVVASGLLLWLGISDIFANRRRAERRQLDTLSEELREHLSEAKENGDETSEKADPLRQRP